MALTWDFTRIEDRATSLYFGLTAEEVKQTGIDFDESCKNPTSGWFRPDPADTNSPEIHKKWVELGWVVVHQKPYVEQMFWALMATMASPGWGITKENIDEVVRRTLIWQEVVGPLDQKFRLTPNDRGIHWDKRYVTEKDIRALVGLHINIATVSLPDFRKRLDRALEDISKGRSAETEKAEAQAAEEAKQTA